MAARTNASFSCSAGERVATGVEWREGRLLELALTERDREADEVGEAMGAAASRDWLDDVASVCLACAEERAGDGEWRGRARPDGCFFVDGVNWLHGGLLRAGRLRRRQVWPCERRASVALRAEGAWHPTIHRPPQTSREPQSLHTSHSSLLPTLLAAGLSASPIVCQPALYTTRLDYVHDSRFSITTRLVWPSRFRAIPILP